MSDTWLTSMSLVDTSGFLIIATIVALLIAGIACTVLIRGRYEAMEQDLRRHGHSDLSFATPLLKRIVSDTQASLRRHEGELNTQAIIDHSFHTELKLLLVGERFVKSLTGLMIILGLVGTFYGLTLSIGKLATLLSSDTGSAAELTDSLTQGLTAALSGMSVAFSTSLVGILAAIVMTLLGVVWNVADRRGAFMAQLEAYLDNVLLSPTAVGSEATGPVASPARAAAHSAALPEQLVRGFADSIVRLEAVVHQFETALAGFSSSTRDFGEFNLHLKDNIQRMSLSFGDLSEAMKRHATGIKRPDLREGD